MHLWHYAAQPVTLDRSRRYVQPEPDFYMKPQGLWVSVEGEDDWPSWCQSTEYFLGSLTYAHQVNLGPDANILHIASAEMLDSFTDDYGTEPERRSRVLDVRNIDWRKVAADYDGIIIAPYQWSRRLGLDWYYGWDVASGCIWSLAAIAEVKLALASAARTHNGGPGHKSTKVSESSPL